MARTVDVPRNSRFTLLVSMAIVIAGLYFAREVLIPIALAILLAFLLTPPVSWLEKMRAPRAVATLLTVAIGMGFIGGLGYVVGKQLASVIVQLPEYQGQLHEKLHRLSQHGGFIRRAEKDMKVIAGNAATQPASQEQAVASNVETGGQSPDRPAATPPTPENPLPVRVYPASNGPMDVLRDYAGSVLTPIATAVVVLVFVIFMLLGREDLRDRIIRLSGHGRLNVTTQALDEASSRISSYLGALSIVNGCYGVSVALGLWIIGRTLGGGHAFPDVLVWGLLVAACRFIPYIGIWIGAGIPIVLAFALFPGNGVLVATVIMFAIFEIIVGQFIEPTWYGATTGMSALAVLVAAVFWTWLWGPIGLLLSTPLTVILVVMGKYVPQLKFLDILLREEAALSPHIRFYQRLVAMDREEAGDLAMDYLKEKKSLQLTFDDLLIPALSMSELDALHERLSDQPLEFVRQSVREIIEELADKDREDRERAAEPNKETMLSSAAAHVAAAASTMAAVASNVASVMTGGGDASADARQNYEDGATAARKLTRLPKGCQVNVLCLPARDAADELASLMLVELLRKRGYCAIAPTADVLASEMIEMVQSESANLVCISAMPPAAIAHARYLYKRLLARHPDMNTVIGLWSMRGDLDKARERVAGSEPARIVTTLREAIEQFEQLAHPLIVRATTTSVASAPAHMQPA